MKIHLPKQYHPKQMEVINSSAKRKVIVAGRRGGKTRTVADIAIRYFMSGRRVLEAAPKFDQTTVFWRYVKNALREPLASKVMKKNESTRTIEFNGAWLRSMTAHDADTLRSDAADLLILDEFSLMDPSAWDEVGAPMLLDTDGDAIFIFTPQRKNHAFQMYARAIGNESGRWQAWHFTSYDNPFLSLEALNEITGDMTEEAYKQEILAEFLDNDGAVFRNVAACMNAPLNPRPEDHKGHKKVAGLDWGKQNDYTVFDIGCVTCREEIHRERFNKIDYVFQRDRIRAAWQEWDCGPILAERNAMGDPNIEMMQREGLPVIAFETTAVTKPPLIENMALVLQRAEFQYQADPVWTAEIEAYERKVSLQTGRSFYSAPEGVHDDTVMGRCLMTWQATNGALQIF
jgi:hypothetical protein